MPGWESGWTVNISRSGVLFVTDSVHVPTGEIESLIELSLCVVQAGGVRLLLPDVRALMTVVRYNVGNGNGVMVGARFEQQTWAECASKSKLVAASRGRDEEGGLSLEGRQSHHLFTESGDEPPLSNFNEFNS